MTIERAILTGQILNAVEIKNMFVAEVTEVGGDTSPIMWGVYIDQFLNELEDLTGADVTFSGFEIQQLISGEWNSTGLFPVTFSTGSNSPNIPNQMAVVLIGKALGIRKIGRKFLAGVSFGAIAGNALVGGAIATAANLLVLYISPVNGIGGGVLQPGIVTKAGAFHAFVGGIVSSFLGTMRRRKPGVGS